MCRPTGISRMREPPKGDRVLRLIDAVLGDLAVRSGMYVGRRGQEGDDQTFVIQTGEEGRLRLGLPDLTSDASIEAVVAEAQARLGEVLGAPVPLCPRHQHALVGVASGGQLAWRCPESSWRCPLGDYEEVTWPQLDIENKLAPILSRRLDRRGISGWVTLGVRRTENGLVAEFGVPEMHVELTRALRDAAAPLPVNLHHDDGLKLRVGPLPG